MRLSCIFPDTGSKKSPVFRHVTSHGVNFLHPTHPYTPSLRNFLDFITSFGVNTRIMTQAWPDGVQVNPLPGEGLELEYQANMLCKCTRNLSRTYYFQTKNSKELGGVGLSPSPDPPTLICLRMHPTAKILVTPMNNDATMC